MSGVVCLNSRKNSRILSVVVLGMAAESESDPLLLPFADCTDALSAAAAAASSATLLADLESAVVAVASAAADKLLFLSVEEDLELLPTALARSIQFWMFLSMEFLTRKPQMICALKGSH